MRKWNLDPGIDEEVKLEENKKDNFPQEENRMMTIKAWEFNTMPRHIHCDASMHLRSLVRLY